ncbi:unnamed protein product, partial [Prorocentrum cordatum]
MAKKATKISGPAARKTKVVGIIQQGGGDRATAAYNELIHKDQAGLGKVAGQIPEDKQLRAIQKLLTKNKISWTHEHQRRTSAATAVTDGSTNTTKGKGKGTAAVEPQPIALDEHDWSIPIAQAPKKLPDGTYESSVSLHSMEDAEKWCTALRRQKEPRAILAIGAGSDNWAHAKIQIPVLRVPHGTTNPRKTFMNGVIYQFGETEVTMKTNVAQLSEADGNATFMRIAIHEADALLVNPTMNEVFSSQFSGAAPVVVGGQRKDKLGSTANERWKTACKSDAKISMGNGLRDVIKSTMQAICPEIPLLDEPSRLLRAGGQAGQRILGAVIAIPKNQEDALLKYSGYQGIASTFSYLGVDAEKQETDKKNIHTVWFNKTISMQEAYSLSKSHEAALGVTKGQVADAAQTVSWTADIVYVGFDINEKTKFAIARSDTEPTNKYWKFGTTTPWVVTERLRSSSPPPSTHNHHLINLLAKYLLHQRLPRLPGLLRFKGPHQSNLLREAQLDKQDTATTSLGAELNDFAQKTDAAVTGIKQASVAPNNTIQLNQSQLQGSLAAIPKKMNLQEERADAPCKKTPRTSDGGKGSN